MNKHLSITNLYKYDITKCDYDWKVTMEIHPFHRFYYIYSGDVEYTSPIEKFKLEKDTLYIFPINKEYSISHNPDEPLHCLWFHCNLNYSLLNNILKLPIVQNTPQFYLLKALEGFITDKSLQSNIISVINSFLLSVQSSEEFEYAIDERLDKVLQYIHGNYSSNLTNSKLSSLLNIDPRYFIRLFKKIYGKTPQEYIASYRAYQAAGLLLQGMQVKEVARMTGFEDTKAFSRFFRAHWSTSPSEFKKSYFLQP